MSTTLPAARLLRERSVLELIPVSRSTWWRGIADGRYPRPIRLGPRSVAWRATEIEALVERLAEASAAAPPVLAARRRRSASGNQPDAAPDHVRGVD